MRALFASDLDDTLLFRLARPDPHVVIVDTPSHGLPIGMTSAAHQMLARLNTRGLFAPVTARARATYERIAMPGGTPSWAAAAAGGVLLHHGEPDQEWADKLRSRAGQAAPLANMRRLLETCAGLSEPRVIDGSYVLADILDAPRFAAQHPRVEAEAAAGRWGASVQHAKIHLFPEHVSKAAAVAEIAERAAADWVIAAGDSLMDAQMLLDADMGLRPAAGELHDTGWTAPHVSDVGCAGIAAGESIMNIVCARLTSGAEALLLSPRTDGGADSLL